MMVLLTRLLPFADKGILAKTENSILTLSGFRNDTNLKALQAELEAEWLELCKKEAIIRVKNSLITTKESQRPSDFNDLITQLNLGRITAEGRQILNNYYDMLYTLEQEAATLQTVIEQAESVEAINQISWPEWVNWEALPLRFKLE